MKKAFVSVNTKIIMNGGFFMKIKKTYRRIVCFALALLTAFTAFIFTSQKTYALNKDDLNSKGISLGCSIINGYSKWVLDEQKSSKVEKTAVYCGLDVSSPYLLTLVGLFYINQSVDLSKLSKNNEYAMETIEHLNGFLQSMGVQNDKAENFRDNVLLKYCKNYKSFNAVGLYIFDCSKKDSLELMNNENVDFVLADGKVPDNMKDLNFDGKTDEKDAVIMQKYFVGKLKIDDKDKREYVKFACDIDGNKRINVTDITSIQQK